ncbi:MAG: hypothetical protein MJ252_25170 [archaeon]|nr:hypothetical protein [archaeon]
MTDDEDQPNDMEDLNEDELLYENAGHLEDDGDNEDGKRMAQGNKKFNLNLDLENEGEGEGEIENQGENENENEMENEAESIDENDSNTDTRFPEEIETGWIKWFCGKDGNSFLVEVSEEFLSKKSNLIGIKFQPYLSTILSKEAPQDPSMSEETLEQFQKVKECYGLIHKRFIKTPQGLALIREKYLNEEYGHCPRQLCEKQFLLPTGLTDDLKYSRVKVYCPLCEEVYKPDRRISKDLDGAYFGTGYAQYFLMAYPDLNPRLKKLNKYVPRVFGFKIFGKNGSKYLNEEKKEKVEEMLKKYGL